MLFIEKNLPISIPAEKQLATLLHRYSAINEEVSFKERMLAFFAAHDDCFERSLEIGHFTASSWLLSKDHSKALLTHHAKLNEWLQLGGHCDGNPDVLGVAIREAQEESGIQHIMPVHEQIFDIDIHLIPANRQEKEHYHYDVRFLLQVMSDEQMVKSNESHDLRWVGKHVDELPVVDASVLRMFNKWMEMP
jgi:8-oxo-dGTP pyrophosphatase MutT (NUDIX family)